MPVELKETVAVLDGICEVAEAESLLAWLQAHPHGQIDVTGCRHLHTAILQVILAARAPLVGVDRADGERAWLADVLDAAPTRDA